MDDATETKPVIKASQTQPVAQPVARRSGITARARWAAFFSVILSPGPLLMSLLSIGLAALVVVMSAKPQPNVLAIALLTAINLLPTGIAGTWIANGLAALAEQGVLLNKGRSAYRQHKLILRDIRAMRATIARFAESTKDTDTKTRCDFWMQACDRLSEHVFAQIEEWSDVVPEVERFNSQVGEITGLVAEMEAIQAKSKASQDDLRKELDEAKAAGARGEEKAKEIEKRLKREVEEERKRVRSLQADIDAKSIRIQNTVARDALAPSFIGGTAGLGASAAAIVATTDVLGRRMCTKCGKPLPTTMVTIGGLCLNCSTLQTAVIDPLKPFSAAALVVKDQ